MKSVIIFFFEFDDGNKGKCEKAYAKEKEDRWIEDERLSVMEIIEFEKKKMGDVDDRLI